MEKINLLIKNLQKTLFEKKNLNESLEIVKKIEDSAKNNNIPLKEVKEEILKKLFGELKDYPKSSLSTIINSIYYLLIDLKIEYKGIKRIVEKHPQILGYSVESMEERVKYLLSLGVVEIGRIVEKHPQILKYSIENNLNPKVEYFKDLGFSKKEIAEYIEKNPAIITYSFENRIVPRIEYAMKIGIKINTLSEIYTLLYPNDIKFIEKLKNLGYSANFYEYLKFKDSEYVKEIIERYKVKNN